MHQVRGNMKKILCAGILACALCVLFTGCGSKSESGKQDKADTSAKKEEKEDKKDTDKDSSKEENTMQIHVSAKGDDKNGDGSEDKPYASIAQALSQIKPGTEVVVHEGIYDPFVLKRTASGTAAAPVVIRAAEDEKAVIKAGEEKSGKTSKKKDSKKKASKKKTEKKDAVGIHMINVQHITLEGLEVEGGTHGIYYESTRNYGENELSGITIKDCTVHGVRGVHGICVYARNDLAPVENLTMQGCEVYDCECGDSESTVLNGNIDGFELCDNVIHDNNNIGIDMIGFEGTARHPKDYNPGGRQKANRYEVDFARNGTCHDNVVYGISAEGNDAYLEDGEYDLCADGIYVDGGQNIRIYNNFVFNCDIGIEVATEHSPDDNELFKVSGIEVYDNVIAGCTGWCGICFGGYDRDLGFTEKCIFRNNTLVDNETQIGVQRSRDNEVASNLLVGGGTAVEFNEDCRRKDMVNNIHDNAAAGFDEKDSWKGKYGRAFDSRDEVIEGFMSRFEGVGSSFVPDDEYVKIYEGRE